MNNYNKLNNITGWVTFLLASCVYLCTIEPTSSFWDCGEYILSCFKLEVHEIYFAIHFILAFLSASVSASMIAHPR